MRILLLFFAVCTAHATTVYVGGSFNKVFGGPLDAGTFSGTFDMSLPAPNSFVLLSSFDVVLQKGATRVEIDNAQSGSFGEVFGEYLSTYGALPVQFSDSKGDSFDIYFAVPFNGAGPVITKTSQGYVADAIVNVSGKNEFSGIGNGEASLTALPEPATFTLFGVGIAAITSLSLRSVRSPVDRRE
jgi:hypothetical protein